MARYVIEPTMDAAALKPRSRPLSAILPPLIVQLRLRPTHSPPIALHSTTPPHRHSNIRGVDGQYCAHTQVAPRHTFQTLVTAPVPDSLEHKCCTICVCVSGAPLLL